MYALLIGYSQIVQKRVLPALAGLDVLTRVDIASRSCSSKIVLPPNLEGRFFDDYDKAISSTKANFAYVSLVNTAHARWVEKALEAGLHVIVDKPAFTDLETAIRMVDLAKRKNLCLAEATGYCYHPQIKLIQDCFARTNSNPTCIIANFSFPPFNPDNFRYNKDLGGGALWDLGAYAATPGRIFFGEKPEEMFCRVCSRNEDGTVDTSFSMLTGYSKDRSMIGHFGFTTEYRNQLILLGPKLSVEVERIFTIPADMENQIKIRQQDKTRVIIAPAADCFLVFVEEVIKAIQNDQFDSFSENLLDDAVFIQKLRLAAGE